jgi:hypothetical protein
MSISMTFTSLKSDLQDYLERGFSASGDSLVYAHIPQFINDAERRLARDLKVLGMVEVVTGSMTTGVGVLQKPSGWRDTVSINFGTGTSNNTRTPLLARSYEYCRSYHPDDTVTGVPRFYADYDYDHFVIVPTPNQNYPFELLYYQIPPLLDEGHQTNWFTTYAPRALRFAALVEASRFLKNDERVQVWEGAYQAEIGALNGEDKARITDRAAFRTDN